MHTVVRTRERGVFLSRCVYTCTHKSSASQFKGIPIFVIRCNAKFHEIHSHIVFLASTCLSLDSATHWSHICSRLSIISILHKSIVCSYMCVGSICATKGHVLYRCRIAIGVPLSRWPMSYTCGCRVLVHVYIKSLRVICLSWVKLTF